MNIFESILVLSSEIISLRNDFTKTKVKWPSITILQIAVVENLKEHAQKLRLSTFVKASFFGTCLLFLLRKVTALSLMFFYVVHDYIRTDQLK